MAISIIQAVPYTYPLGPTGPANIPLGAAPTQGNMLIAALPIDYGAEGFTINPYWTLLINRAGDFPMLWYGHPIGPGESADLPPFYDGFDSGNFSEYAGGIVFELAGAAADVSALPNGYLSALSNTTLTLPGFATTADNSLVIAYVQSHAVDDAPPFNAISISGTWAGQIFVTPSPLAENLNNFSFLVANVIAPASGTEVTYDATFTPPSFQGLVSAVAIAPAGPAPAHPLRIAITSATALPCVPCCTLTTGYVI